MGEVTRFILAGLAVCWLAVGAAAVRGRRRNVVRHGPVRWHRAVATLSGWSPGDDGPPVAATWCRPLVQPVLASLGELPRQRASVDDEESAPVSAVG